MVFPADPLSVYVQPTTPEDSSSTPSSSLSKPSALPAAGESNAANEANEAYEANGGSGGGVVWKVSRGGNNGRVVGVGR